MNDSGGAGHTVREILLDAQRRLAAAGVDAPRLNAEILLAHVLRKSRAEVVILRDERLPTDAHAAFDQALVRRLRREPLQHITGRTEFWSLEILCDRSALVPRPETELLVEAALECLKGVASPVIADIGVGTGCVSVAIATERPDAHIHCTDIDPHTLSLAERNLKLHNLGGRVSLMEGDLVEPLFRIGLAGTLDGIVSNPPYIPTADLADLQPEVRDYDPRGALDGGASGLEVIRRLAKETPGLVKTGGFLALEIGAGQAQDVRKIIDAGGAWRCAQTILDGAGHERVIVARRE